VRNLFVIVILFIYLLVVLITIPNLQPDTSEYLAKRSCALVAPAPASLIPRKNHALRPVWRSFSRAAGTCAELPKSVSTTEFHVKSCSETSLAPFQSWVRGHWSQKKKVTGAMSTG